MKTRSTFQLAPFLQFCLTRQINTHLNMVCNISHKNSGHNVFQNDVQVLANTPQERDRKSCKPAIMQFLTKRGCAQKLHMLLFYTVFFPSREPITGDEGQTEFSENFYPPVLCTHVFSYTTSYFHISIYLYLHPTILLKTVGTRK